MAKGTIIVNRGVRTYNLLNGPDGKPRTLLPGGSIEVLDEKEAEHLLRYTDLQDMAKASPQTAAKIKAHEAEIDRLKAENEKLKKQHPGIADQDAGAGTGFAGGAPELPGSKRPDLETDPTHAENESLEEAQKDAEKADKESNKHGHQTHKRR